MKHFFTTTFMLLLCTFAFAQNWAPKGATWHYSCGSWGHTGYFKVEAVADTLIDGKTWTVLTQKSHTYNHHIEKHEYLRYGNIYMYEDSGKVYHYANGTSNLLYNFNAVADDTWHVTNEANENCTGSSEVKVTLAETETISALDFKTLHLEQQSNASWSLAGKVIERIGAVNTFMLPQIACITDVAFIYALRCYSDDVVGTINFRTNLACDATVGINKQVAKAQTLQIFPNPATNQVYVKTENNTQNFTAVVTDVLGKTFVLNNNTLGNSTFDVSMLKNGVYTLQLINRQEIVYSGRFIKQ